MSADLLPAGDHGSRKVTVHDLFALDPAILDQLEPMLRAEAERRGLDLDIYALHGSKFDYEFVWHPKGA